MKWIRATEETIPKSSGFPIMLIVKWFEGEGDDERTLVRHMTNNQLLDKVKGTWDYHYFLDETSPTPEPGKEYTREFVQEILEWVDGKYFQCDLYDEATERHTKMWTTVYENEDNEPLRTTEELINQYLNSKK